MIPRTFKVRPSEVVVLIHHVMTSEDAENDADRTVDEIIAEIDSFQGWISKGVLESALYCCNMEHERGNFWHPQAQSFDRFLKQVIPRDLHFDRYYNVIREAKDG
jgi:hypothetical protein